MAAIERRKLQDGTTVWRAKIRKRGHSVSITRTRLTDLRDEITRVEGEIRAGTYGVTRESERRTAAELIDQYLVTRMPDKRPRTQAAQIPQVKWWRKKLGQLPLVAVTPGVLEDALSELTCSGATKNRYLSAISQVFDYGWKTRRWMSDNPTRHVKRQKETPIRDRTLSADEIKAWENACKSSYQKLLYPAWLAVRYTGMRRDEVRFLARTRKLWQGEVRRRKWPVSGWFDASEGVAVLQSTKNGEPRVVALPPLVVTALRRAEPVFGNAYLFPSRKTDGPIDLRKALEKARAEAGLDGGSWHRLRHTLGTLVAETTGSAHDVRAVLGHRSEQAARHYVHAKAEHARKVLEKVFGERS